MKMRKKCLILKSDTKPLFRPVPIGFANGAEEPTIEGLPSLQHRLICIFVFPTAHDYLAGAAERLTHLPKGPSWILDTL